jgi:hypothetical protein
VSAHAFKEWHVIVEALGAGAQILILRKGGIAEGPGGFAVKAERFWLFPTAFHAQAEKTKPEASRFFAPAPPAADSIRLTYFAEIVRSAFLSDWDNVQALDPFHLWTQVTIEDRFKWNRPPGIHAFAVRVFRADFPVDIPLSPDLAGCKSWVEIPLLPQPSQVAGKPVLSDGDFYDSLSRIPL